MHVSNVVAIIWFVVKDFVWRLTHDFITCTQFRLDALTELRAFMRTECLCISVLRAASGPRVKLVRWKSALNPWGFILLTVLCDVPVVFCFVDYSTRRFLLSIALCYFVLVFFSPFSIAITSHGEERERELIVVLFVSLFDLRLFGFVCFVFLLVSGKGCG